MKNYMTVIILAFACAFSLSHLSAQNQKTEKTKVIIVEKTVDGNGEITETKIIKEGEDAENYLNQIEKEEDEMDGAVQVYKTKKYKFTSTDNEGNTREWEWTGGDELSAEHKELLESMEIEFDSAVEIEKLSGEGEESRTVIKVITDENGEKNFEVKEEELHVILEKEKAQNTNKAQLGVYIKNHEKGVEVTEIIEGSAAEKAGIKPGYVITRINDTPVADLQQLIAAISEFQPNDIIIVETWLDGERKAFEAVLQPRKELFEYKSWKEVEEKIRPD